ncbi:MAG: metal-dependent phosphohydrolase [Betaproteobacteria bacterium HGW-Betaproteobacteria-22]|nr:MAG: metal-dependent phosphohydrolase [Betaproteobacteria bacterium HGW-Betaproteobacteria-22]
MHIQQMNVNQDHSVPIIDLPWLFRLVRLDQAKLPNGGYRFQANLFHEKASIAVTWINSKADDRLTAGSLVTPRWTSKTVCTQGQIIINRLLPVNTPGNVNIFDTVPYEWVKNREIIRQAQEMIDSLPPCFIKLINGIFWDYRRFYRFLVGPSSLNGHHKDKHGNLRHSIEVVNNALMLAKERKTICPHVLATAAFLHDAGKADEYQFNYERNCFEISTRGVLLGHKLSIVEWIAAAVAQYQINIPENQLLSLLHALTATKGVPDWVGIREPVSPEANLLSIADRLSGQDDLYAQTMPSTEGFGRYHRHLRGRPFLVA